MSFLIKLVKVPTARFANLKIRTKVSIGFGVVLIMLAIGGATAVYSVATISGDFDRFLARSRTFEVVDRIEVALLNLRRHTIRFSFTADPESDAKAREAANDAKIATAEALELIETGALRENIGKIDESLNEYMKLFDSVVDLKTKFETLRSETIDPSASELQDVFDAMADKVSRSSSGTAKTLVLTGSKGLVTALLDANSAFSTQKMLVVKKTELAFDDLRLTLSGIKSVADSEELKALAEEADALQKKYYKAFKTAIDYALETNRLIQGDMTHNSEVIDGLTETIKTAVLAQERTIVDDVHSFIARSKLLNIVLMIVGLAVGIVFSSAIGRGIANPVMRMTRVMRKLADGDTGIEVPDVARKDEVGQMATTVQVFRDNMVKAEELSAEQRAEQERKEKRQQAIEEYIAQFVASVAAALNLLATSASDLQSTANAMSATAEQMQQQTANVAASSEQATSNVQTAASAADELSASISEINRQVTQSTEITGQAVTQASTTDAKVQRLAEAADKIGDVVELISEIAEQTNLLALNATIEAARAGEAGKGFAVVASEVKSLATQTAKATEEISGLITAIQGETQESVESIKVIGRTIGDVNEITAAIAAAVEQQGAATEEIARNVQQAATGTSDVCQNISGVQAAASQTGTAANQVLEAASELAKQAKKLRTDVDGFLGNIRAA